MHYFNSFETAEVDFKIVSLNARGVRDFYKRKSIFTWIEKQKADIVFLQETYSTPEVVNEWKFQYRGQMFHSHGSNHSRGVLVLINENLQFEVKNLKEDIHGRFVAIEALIQESPFLLLNLYAPIKCSEQCNFFDTISSILEEVNADESCQIILGGDFNVHLNPILDNLGGSTVAKSSVKNIKDLMLAHDLVDIWRLQNPESKPFTWSQKNPLLKRRLDYWLVSDSVQDFISKTDIIPAIKSNHSAITLSLNGFKDRPFGPSYWKFNSSLVNDEEYVNLITSRYPGWLAEFADVTDKRVLWDLIKYRIRQVTIQYS